MSALKISLFIVLCVQFGTKAAKFDHVFNPCPDDWLQATFVNMGCLLFNTTTPYNWEEANVFCQEKAGTLVEIHTAEQLEFLQMELDVLEESLGKFNWWASGTDIGHEGNWVWEGSLAPVERFVWGPGLPVGGLTWNCMFLGNTYNYRGIDGLCSSNLYPICQIMTN
jgi:hypothetical protein